MFDTRQGRLARPHDESPVTRVLDTYSEPLPYPLHLSFLTTDKSTWRPFPSMPHVNKVAEQVFGILGTICWTVQLLPQVWKSYREKKTHGLSQWFVYMWGMSGAIQGIYIILQRVNIPLMVQPQLFGFLSFVSWGQCQYYGGRRSKKVSLLLIVSTILFWGIFELVFILTLRPVHDRGQHTPAAVFGIISSVTISVALFPQYWEIYKRREVVGISVLFIFIDMMGGVFNDLSLAFKEFDAIAAVTYTLVIVLDGAVVVAALILNPRARRRRRMEAARMSSDIVVQSSMSQAHSLEERSTPLAGPGLDVLYPPASTNGLVVEETEERVV